MQISKLESPFLRYLITKQLIPGERLPTLNQIGAEMGVSVGKLREQLEIARSLGLVSVRPRIGIVREPFDFAHAMLASVLFSLGSGEAQFEQFSELRQAIEIIFWEKAVKSLASEDKQKLQKIVASAWAKLKGNPIHVPNDEHRQLHLTIFSRLKNPFVQGMLATYWDAYEASELTRFSPYDYWLEVWDYHEKIVAAIIADDAALGLTLLKKHFGLLQTMPSVENSDNNP